nr:hypothetical protein [Tanacetum cinerariifolium]
MSTQQDIYAAGFENRPHMLNKENYVPWPSRLLRYAKSRPNGKLIHNFIINGPYVRLMIPELGDPNRKVPVNETFHVQTDDELTEKELKQIEADDQAIQTILLRLPEDIYATVDSCETAQEIWLRVQQMMIGSDIGIQKKKAKLFNEWERFTSTDGESIKSYYHRFLKLMNDLKRNKYFPKKIAMLHQDQPSFNQNYVQQPMPNPVDIIDPTTAMNMALALMAKAFKLNYSAPTNNNQRIYQTHVIGRLLNRNVGNLNGYNNVQNVGNQVIQNAAQNPRVQNVGNQNGLIVVPGNANQNPNGNGNLVAARTEGNATEHNGNQIRCYNCRGLGHFARNCTVRPRRRDAAYPQTQLLITQKEEAGIQLQAEEFDLMAAATDLDEIKEVNTNCILMANLQQASTSGTQTDKAPVYDSDGSSEVHNYEDCYDNEIFNMFTQEEQYTKILEPIPEPHQVKSTIVTLQRVVKHRMTLDTHNWSSSDHQELYKIIKDENFPILNQVDARVQNFEIYFLKEAAKFVGDFKSLAKEADESLAKHKALELEIERLLRAVKLKNENVELEFQALNYAKENAHLKITYKNQFDFISVTRTPTKTIIDSLQNKLHDTIYENAKLRAQLFDTVSDQKDTTRGTSANTKFAKQSILRKPTKVGEIHALLKPVTSNSIPTSQESKVMKNDKVIAPRMFRINLFKPSREEKHVPNKVRASVRTKPITVSQPPVFTKKDVNSDSNGLSSAGIDNTKTRRPQPRSNTKNDRVLSAS